MELSDWNAEAVDSWNRRSRRAKQETIYEKWISKDKTNKIIFEYIIANPRHWEISNPPVYEGEQSGWYGTPVHEDGSCDTHYIAGIWNGFPFVFVADEDWVDTFIRIPLKQEKFFVAAEQLRMVEV